VQILWR